MSAPAPHGADVVFRGRRVATPAGVMPASVYVREGRIAAVSGYDDIVSRLEVVDLGDAVLLPGLVDTHVHINEPGRTEWEGFETATLAAAAGGVTTLVDMPLNSVPATTTLAGLEAKRRAAEARCHVDVGFWGGLVPGNRGEIEALHEAGVLGFKCFLAPSGVDEFGHVTEGDLRAALPLLAELGAPLLAHAELPDPDALSASGRQTGDPRSYATYLATRGDRDEIRAAELLVRLCRDTRARVHVVHVSAAAVPPLLESARRQGLALTAETCPHYLYFAAEDVPDGATELKCAPPIRGRANRDALWNALEIGELDMIASDHSPCPPAMKRREDGDFLAAWGGIASLQLGLSAVWAGARPRGHGPAELARWMAAAPARLAGLEGRKGAIAPGRDADLVVWRPDAEWTVEPERLRHRHPLTPYGGLTLPGVVEATYLRGEPIYGRGESVGAPTGRLLSRNGT